MGALLEIQPAEYHMSGDDILEFLRSRVASDEYFDYRDSLIARKESTRKEPQPRIYSTLEEQKAKGQINQEPPQPKQNLTGRNPCWVCRSVFDTKKPKKTVLTFSKDLVLVSE